MIDFSNFLVMGFFQHVDFKFAIKFFEKCELKGVKCNFCFTIDFSDFFVMGAFKYVYSKKHIFLFVCLISVKDGTKDLVAEVGTTNENVNVLGRVPP